jgi:hypothetical protein
MFEDLEVWIAVLPDLVRDVIGRVLFLRVGVHGKDVLQWQKRGGCWGEAVEDLKCSPVS